MRFKFASCFIVLLFVSVITFVFSCQHLGGIERNVQSETKLESTGIQYQYNVIVSYDKALFQDLSTIGNEGFQIINARRVKIDSLFGYEFIVMKRKPDP